MTIDKALDRIAGTTHCWIVWRVDSGEIVSVTGWDHSPTREEFGQAVTSMGTGATYTRKGRFLESSEITRGLLEEPANESADARQRIATCNQWANAPTGWLVDLLEWGDYGEVIDRAHGRDYVIRLLYRLRWHELGPFRDRLAALAGRDPRNPSETRKVWLQLAQYLAVFDSDVGRLVVLYRDRPRWTCLSDFLECFGDARIRDPILVWQIINIVDELRLPFGPRCEAMVALGKIGRFAELGSPWRSSSGGSSISRIRFGIFAIASCGASRPPATPGKSVSIVPEGGSRPSGMATSLPGLAQPAWVLGSWKWPPTTEGTGDLRDSTIGARDGTPPPGLPPATSSLDQDTESRIGVHSERSGGESNSSQLDTSRMRSMRSCR